MKSASLIIVILAGAVFFAEFVNKPLNIFFFVAQLVSLLLAEGKDLSPTTLIDKALYGLLHKFVYADMPRGGNLFSFGEQRSGNTGVQVFSCSIKGAPYFHCLNV